MPFKKLCVGLLLASKAAACAGAAETQIYSQMSSAFGFAPSQEFETAYSQDDSLVADDFIVSATDTWEISEVYIGGAEETSTPIIAANLYFYTDAPDGGPGTLIPGCTYDELSSFEDDSANITIRLPQPCQLFGGVLGTKYWIAAQMRSNYSEHWYWRENPIQHNSSAYFENPANGYETGCTTWMKRSVCNIDATIPDQMFKLKGTSADVLFADDLEGGF
jgi:hypothetical protein